MGDDLYPAVVIGKRGYNRNCDICRIRNASEHRKLDEVLRTIAGMDTAHNPDNEDEDAPPLLATMRTWVRIKLHDIRKWWNGGKCR